MASVRLLLVSACLLIGGCSSSESRDSYSGRAETFDWVSSRCNWSANASQYLAFTPDLPGEPELAVVVVAGPDGHLWVHLLRERAVHLGAYTHRLEPLAKEVRNQVEYVSAVYAIQRSSVGAVDLAAGHRLEMSAFGEESLRSAEPLTEVDCMRLSKARPESVTYRSALGGNVVVDGFRTVKRSKFEVNASRFDYPRYAVSPRIQTEAVSIVQRALVDIEQRHTVAFEFKSVPMGRGIFVKGVPASRPQVAYWMVVGEKVFPLNGAAMKLTPSALTPEESSAAWWEATQFVRDSGSEASVLELARQAFFE